MASYQEIESWFQKEEKENQALLELTKDIKEILSKRADQVDPKSVGAADELTEEGQEEKPTMEQLTQELDGIVEEMKSQMTEVDVKLREGVRPNFQDPFHGRGKEAETKPMEQSWKKPRQERMDLSSPVLVIDEKLSPSSETEQKPKEVATSIHPPVSAAVKESEKEVEPGKQEEEQGDHSLPPAGFQLPSWLTCNRN